MVYPEKPEKSWGKNKSKKKNLKLLKKGPFIALFLIIISSCSKFENSDPAPKNNNLEIDINSVKTEISNIILTSKTLIDENKTYIIENKNIIEKQYDGNVLLFLNKSNIGVNVLMNPINNLKSVLRKNKSLANELKNSEFRDNLIKEVTIKQQILVGAESCLGIREAMLAQCSANFFSGIINSVTDELNEFGISFFISNSAGVPITLSAAIYISVRATMSYYQCEQNADDYYNKCKKIKN